MPLALKYRLHYLSLGEVKKPQLSVLFTPVRDVEYLTVFALKKMVLKRTCVHSGYHSVGLDLKLTFPVVLHIGVFFA